jgi:hypothetical protein
METATVQTPAPTVTTIHLPETRIELQPGERYAGLVLGADGMPSHHLVLLPGDADDITWPNAKAWAAGLGGELPTRQEQSLLFANLKGEFKREWYWSGQEHEEYGSGAWNQTFYDGLQGNDGKSWEGRARAVRRFAA